MNSFVAAMQRLVQHEEERRAFREIRDKIVRPNPINKGWNEGLTCTLCGYPIWHGACGRNPCERNTDRGQQCKPARLSK
jgi:hypothetical protein